jgi:PDZ domain/Aspartyl protease
MLARLLLISLFLLCHLTGNTQTLGFSLADGRKRVEIPIEIHNNLVVVPVLLNGMLPLKFIVDTGVRTAILTEKTYTDILNLSYSRKYTIAGPGGENVIEAYVTNGVELQLPGVNGRGHALLVLQEDYLELRNNLGTDVHGVLGYELFSRFVVKVDYRQKTLTLMVPEKLRPGRKYESIPISIEDTKPYMNVAITQSNGEKKNMKFLVDSGASHSLLIEPKSDSTLDVPVNSVSCVVGRGLGGAIRGKTGRINELEIGHYKMNNVIANFPDPNSYMDTLKLGNTFRNGTLGGEILSRFTVIYDFSKETIYLKKNSDFKKGFYYNLSGLTVRAKGNRLNTFEITDIRKFSSSDKAGLKIGDQILSVNGLNVKDLDLNQLNGYLNLKPGKKVLVSVKRNNELFSTKMVLENNF